MYRMDHASRGVIVSHRQEDLRREAAAARLLRTEPEEAGVQPRRDRFVVPLGLVTSVRVRLPQLLAGSRAPQRHPRAAR